MECVDREICTLSGPPVFVVYFHASPTLCIVDPWVELWLVPGTWTYANALPRRSGRGNNFGIWE